MRACPNLSSAQYKTLPPPPPKTKLVGEAVQRCVLNLMQIPKPHTQMGGGGPPQEVVPGCGTQPEAAVAPCPAAPPAAALSRLSPGPWRGPGAVPACPGGS